MWSHSRLGYLRGGRYCGLIASMRKFELQGLLVSILGLVTGCGGNEVTTNYVGTGGSSSSSGGSGTSGGKGNGSGGGGAAGTTITDSCGTFSACGGTIDGTWQLDNTCVSGDLTAAVTASLNLPSACNGLITSVTQNVSGTVTFANGTSSNDVTVTVTETATYTSACLSAQSGQPTTLDATLCTSLETSLKNAITGQSSTCTFSGGTCNCSITVVNTDTSSSSYTISGHTIVPSDGSEPMDYCVTGTTMKTSFMSSGGVIIYYSFHKIS